MELKFADIHLHVGSKFILDIDKKNRRKSLWSSKPYKNKHHNNRSKPTNYDQSTLQNLTRGKYSLALSALYPLEKVLGDSKLSRTVAALTTGLSPKHLRNIMSHFNCYFDLTTHEYTLKKNLPKKKNKLEFILVQNKADLSSGKTKILLTIEGGHSLQGKNCPSTPQGKKQLLKNLTTIKDWEHPVFFLTLAHFQYNHLCGQSWAVPIPGIARGLTTFDRLEVNDKTKSIQNLGKEVIKQCLVPSGKYNRKILIDVKHMHIVSRYEYYKLLEQPDGSYKSPIIASHIAPSGLTNKDSAEKVNPKNNIHRKYDRFNPWPINLCDEELKIIANSNGIVGLSLDQRILGAGNKSFSKALKKQAKEKSTRSKQRLFYNLLFLENLFHLAKTMGSWNHICIGTDFDGMIDPIDTCPTAEHMHSFTDMLLKHIESNPADHNQFLFGEPNFTAILTKVFETNLNNFVQRNFD